MTAYPDNPGARDAFILARRPARASHDPWRAHGVMVEQEPTETGELAEGVTVFLTGRECPWHCAMCDLWKFATADDTPLGAIPHQIREALRLGDAPLAQGRYIKLYNAGSFFDPRAVPPADYPAIAHAIAGFSKVIVESHPLLIGPRLDPLLEALGAEPSGGPALEVAMGLETVHPAALERLNKRMTLDAFRHAADWLERRGVALRVFALVSPPFVPPAEHAEWLRRTVDMAFDCGAWALSLIPMRAGNGTVEVLEADGQYQPPTLDLLEESIDIARRGARGRVFADVWDVERLASCDACFNARTSRLVAMNLTQRPIPRVSCPVCAPVEARA